MNSSPIFTTRLFAVLYFLVFTLKPQQALSNEEELLLTGQAEFRYLWLSIYKAELYTLTGEYHYFDTFPFSLSITYHRSFKSRHIIDETRRQWQKQKIDHPQVATWLQALSGIIPDIEKDNTLTLHVDENHISHFYLNDDEIGSIDSSEFSRFFSGIWLSPDSTEPDFTSRLIGEH
jgi:hypothetical protein